MSLPPVKPMKYQFPVDETDTELYPPFLLTVDEEGDVWLENDERHTFMVSYRQAQALHQQLGQALIAFDRQFNVRLDPKLKVYTNDE